MNIIYVKIMMLFNDKLLRCLINYVLK